MAVCFGMELRRSDVALALVPALVPAGVGDSAMEDGAMDRGDVDDGGGPVGRRGGLGSKAAQGLASRCPKVDG